VRSTLTEQSRLNPDLVFVDGAVTEWLVYPRMAPYNRFDHVLSQVFPDARSTTVTDRGLAVDGAGRVHPVTFRPEFALEGAAVCLDPEVESRSVALDLPEPLPADMSFVRVRYQAEAASAVGITVHKGGAVPDLRMAVDTYETGAGEGQVVAAPGDVPVASVVLEVTGPAEICLTGVEVGAMQPER
jgi:hypothetical protein